MKTIRKVLCAVISAMIVIASVVPALAAAPTGQINITNAEQGKIYTIYKIFDATYYTYEKDDGNGGTETVKTVAYTVSDPDVIAAIQNAGGDYAQAGDCPFKLVGDGTGEFYYVEHKDLSKESIGRGWIKANLIDTGIIGEYAHQTITSGNTVTFDVPYGYYLMTPGDGTIATVNTNTPRVDIVDKNPRSPSEPAKSADKETVVVGDTVTYTVSFKATNFYTESASYTKIIEKYNVKDTSAGLKDKTLVSAKYYTEYDETTGEFGGESGDIADITANPDASDENVTVFNIPWAAENSDGELYSLYPSPVYVVLTYTAVVTGDIFNNKDLTADNKIKVNYDYDNTTGYIPGEPEVHIPTIGLSLHKVDSRDDTVTLEGAQFRLYKIEGSKKLYYTIDGDKTVSWKDSVSDAKILTADNDFNTLEIEGIAPGSYKLEEIKAPDGYKIPANPFDLTVEAVNGEYTVTFDSDVIDTLTGKENVYTVYVANGTSSALPSTGGTGTALIIAAGSVMFLCAAIILITKKRMKYNEEE